MSGLLYHNRENYFQHVERRDLTVSLVNCAHCGKLIVQAKLRMDLCSDCFTSQESEFQLLKDAMRAHPGANVMELSVQTGISTAKIMHWVRDGRIHTG